MKIILSKGDFMPACQRTDNKNNIGETAQQENGVRHGFCVAGKNVGLLNW
jgi:hypothetical protein